MSYTWQNGDLITAERLNSMKSSVATVIVDTDSDAWQYDCAFMLVYIKMRDGRYPLDGQIAYEGVCWIPGGRAYIPCSIPPESDDYGLYVLFPDVVDSFASYTISGDISQTKITAQVYQDGSWISDFWYGFKVSGDGMVVVSYNDE